MKGHMPAGQSLVTAVMARPALGEHTQNSNKTTLLTAPSAAIPASDAANTEIKLCFLSI